MENSKSIHKQGHRKETEGVEDVSRKKLGNTRVLIGKNFNAKTETKGNRIKELSWKEETERER